ncbi:OLC1v1017580C1 [Oldenlandia corymbosa var. corymbosa]|uniref:OLC1v1017580C1 n=1 Tax=Oldenlandia corymbosa var. corymbosa TaxID=529605 RepID=A0AAV1E9U4_OLDCO|nr:OLC1v1017580C1 [Oldenlandia corymbosa var. corymbosa]
MAEIEEESPTTKTDETTPLLSSDSNPAPETARTEHMKVPEVEVHLYKLGKGPIDVFKVKLGGYEQDQLEVRDILEKYGFKSLYAFTPGSGRGVPIRFRNGRSLLSYKDGAVLHLDGQPKDSLIKPVTKIVSGVAFLTILILFAIKEAPPGWASKLNMSGGTIPPWFLACVVIVFTRLSKRTKKFFEKRRMQNG